MALKGVATTTTITFNSTTYKVYGSPIQKGTSREAVNVTTLSDTTMQYIAGAVENWDEFTITIADEGGTAPTTSTASALFSISSSITDGTTPATVSVSFKALLTKVSPGTIEAEGNRKATYELTFQPSGESTTSVGS